MISVTVLNVLPVKNRENTGFFVVFVYKPENVSNGDSPFVSDLTH